MPLDTIAGVTGHDSNARYGPLDVAVYLLGAAGLAACLTLVWFGMRAVMNVGGFCAEGGPFVIETPCPEGVPLLMILGIFGLVGLAWPALFISLGWNFLEYAFNPPAPEYGIVWGWLIPGVIFVIMGGSNDERQTAAASSELEIARSLPN